jgi:hypothetical protein
MSIIIRRATLDMIFIVEIIHVIKILRNREHYCERLHQKFIKRTKKFLKKSLKIHFDRRICRSTIYENCY